MSSSPYFLTELLHVENQLLAEIHTDPDTFQVILSLLETNPLRLHDA